MSFYMSTNGMLHPYSFAYLEDDANGPRLEKTQIHSDQQNTPSSSQSNSKKEVEFYAINIMTSPLITETPDCFLKQVKEKMKQFGMHHIPIVKNYKLLGMISDRDLLKINMMATFYYLKAQNIMSTILIVCDEDTPINQIAKVLLEENISCLPVVDRDHKLTGIISRTDLLKVIVKNRIVIH